jgi:hypothetical protein
MPWSIFGVKGVIRCAWDFATMMLTMVMLLSQPFTQACCIFTPQNSCPKKVFLVRRFEKLAIKNPINSKVSLKTNCIINASINGGEHLPCFV